MDGYLNVVEVEAAIARLRDANPQLCKLLKLPNPTAGRRTSHALRISTAPGAGRDTLLVTGGIHALEWGTSDAVVSFATDLLAAYVQRAGLAYGGKVFTKEAIAAFLDSRIRYTDIAPACTEALARLPATKVQCLDDAIAADVEARAVARSWLKLPEAA